MSKHIVITGASSGIGAATARSAVKSGHRVTLAARSIDKLKSLVEELGADNACAIECDVTEERSVCELFQKAEQAFGDIHVVFANAGVGASASGTKEGNPDDFSKMINTNVLGVTLTAWAAVSHLERSGGHLIVTGSRAGRVAIPGSVYGATKWYVRGYVQNLRAEFSDYGIRVTNIEPGMVDTPFFDEAKPDALQPEDIAEAAMFAIGQPERANIADMQVIPAQS